MTMQSPPSPSPEMPGYSPAGPPPANRGTNTMAVLALVFAFIFSPLGIVFGIIGRKQIKQTGEGGRGLATAGLVIGILGILAGVLAIVLAVVGAAAAVSTVPQTPAAGVGAPSSQQSSQPTDPSAGAAAGAIAPEAVAAQIEGQTQGRATGASCPSALPAQVGASVQCTASVDGSERPITATVTSVQGGNVAFDIAG